MKIEQVLHGYKDGHELLASSIPLSANDARYMRIQSDISGSLPVDGCYLKGYPLLDSALYVIATTWYAPEMKRPGCVWTHSILIKFDDLIKISNFQYFLKKIFVRPSRDKTFSLYSKSIKIEDDLLINQNFEVYSSIHIQTLYNVFSAYFEDKEPLTLQYTKEASMEDYVFLLWNVFPYNQKCSFSFAIGISDSIKLNGSTVPDIQFVRSNNRFTQSFVFNSASNLDNKVINIDADILFLTRLSLKLPVSYSSFMSNFSKDVSKGKKQSLAICRVYRNLTNEKDKVTEEGIIQLLGLSFPSPIEARKLKVSLLGNNILNLFDEGKLLFALLVSPYSKSFNLVDLNYEKRIISFISNNSIDSLESFSNVITKVEITPNTKPYEYLRLLSNSLSPVLLGIMNNRYRELLSVCVMMNPNIATMPEYWHIDKYLLYENFKNLVNIKDSNLDWQEIFYLFLDNNIPIASSLTLDYIPNAAVYILDWFDRNEKEIPPNYYSVLENSKKQIVSWIMNNEDISLRLFFLFTNLLNPNDNLTLEIKPLRWRKIIENNKLCFSGKSSQEERVNYFLLAIAFNYSIKESIVLMEICFDYVYTTIMNAKHYTANWELLDKHTPDLGFHNWDKGERLRMTIVERLISSDMEAGEIKRIVRSKKSRDDFYKRYKKSKKGGFFFFLFGD